MGLLRTASRAAVASSVHGRVQRRQQKRWAEPQPPASAPPPPAAAAPAPPRAPAPSAQREQLELLAQLGELRTAGVLTDAEFETKKAAILNG